MAEKIAIRDAYGAALAKLGRENEKIVALEADVGGSSKSNVFGAAFPGRYYNVGVAELNMTAMAAGLASAGCIPFVNAFAAFLASRAADPIASMIAYDNLNVKLCGAYCGLSDAYDGASHHALFDLAYLRALPNLTVVSVCDAVETEKAVFAAAAWNGPVYLRLSRAPAPVIFDASYRFVLGKGVLLREGFDVTLAATGTMVHQALEAACLLAAEGVSARVLNLHTVQPLDCALVEESALRTGCIVTVEEHSVRGGLGSAVAETVTRACPVPLECVGLSQFTQSGSYEALLKQYGLDAPSIAEKARCAIRRKRG